MLDSRGDIGDERAKGDSIADAANGECGGVDSCGDAGMLRALFLDDGGGDIVPSDGATTLGCLDVWFESRPAVEAIDLAVERAKLVRNPASEMSSPRRLCIETSRFPSFNGSPFTLLSPSSTASLPALSKVTPCIFTSSATIWTVTISVPFSSPGTLMSTLSVISDILTWRRSTTLLKKFAINSGSAMPVPVPTTDSSSSSVLSEA
jgi:hypothetical protein